MVRNVACLVALCLLLTMVAPVAAAPAITGVSGSLEHGSQLTLTGSGFGVHGDYHTAPDKIISLWHDFEGGSLTATDYGTVGVISAACELHHNSATARGATDDEYLYRRNNTGIGALLIDSGNYDEYFVSHYIRISEGFDVSTGGSTQWKMTRLWSGNNGMNIYPGYGYNTYYEETYWGMNVENASPIVPSWYGRTSTVHHHPQLGEWHRWDMYVKKSTTASSNDGKLQVYIDGEMIYDFKRDTGDKYFNGGDFDSEGGDFARGLHIGSFMSGGSSGTYIDYDDVYFSHTIARVELGDAPTWDACSHVELQIPTVWADGQTTLNFNRGTFADGDTAYLYVFDADGNVNQAGYEITVPEPASLILFATGASIFIRYRKKRQAR